MANEKAVKFLRCIAGGPTTTIPQTNLWTLKLVYEFWGFCVNGGSDLRSPGGFANNGISMPIGFESGSTVLLASGSDGFTLAGDNVFTAASINWTSASLSSSWLVTWKSGSSSTDDSIYKITSVVNSSSVIVDTLSGGTPGSGSARPFFTARTNVNFRVIDFVPVSNLSGFVTNQYLIMQMNASAINPGQSNSQVKLRINNSGNDFAVTLSPSGSWNGSTFSDSTWELTPDAFSVSDTGAGGGQWSTAGTVGLVTMMADQASLHLVVSGDWCSSVNSWFNVEIPQRLYPQANDPNPICAALVAQVGIASTMANFLSNFNGYMLANPLNLLTSERSVSMARTFVGHSFDSSVFQGNRATRLLSARFAQSTYNSILNNVLISEVVLANRSAPTRFALCKNQLRRSAFLQMGDAYPTFAKFGRNGEWVHMGYGVLFPWDNAVIPRGLFV